LKSKGYTNLSGLDAFVDVSRDWSDDHQRGKAQVAGPEVREGNAAQSGDVNEDLLSPAVIRWLGESAREEPYHDVKSVKADDTANK
jgi:hypothetical protein